MFDDEITVRQIEDGKLAERLHVAVEATDAEPNAAGITFKITRRSERTPLR